MKIKIIDRNFAHAQYSSDYQDSKYMVWDRTPPSKGDIVFITDTSLPSSVNINNSKIAELLNEVSKLLGAYSQKIKNSRIST